MFHFPASTSTQTMHSSAGNTTQPVLGSPIRTSSDQRFVDNSPRHNAASHVLHRLSMPRHPPYALNNQTIIQHTQTHTTTQHGGACSDTQNTKTVLQTYKTKNPSQHHTPSTHKHAHKDAAKKKDARVHYTVLTQHTHTTTTTHHKQRSDHSRASQQDNHNHTQHKRRAQAMCCPRHPTACQHTTTSVCENWSHTRATQSRSIQPCRCASTRNLYKTNKWQSHLRRHQPPTHNRGHNNKKLLRKEVIQPHLPVRLPCYDFVPIADPTFDHSLTSLGHGLRVLPTFMT